VLKVIAQVLAASLLIGVGFFAAMGGGVAGGDGSNEDSEPQPGPSGPTTDVAQLNPEDVEAFESKANDPNLEWVPCGQDAYSTDAVSALTGCEATLLYKNERTGAEGFFVRTPKGFHWPRHYHTNQEHLVALEGSTPTRVADGRVLDIGPGNFVYIPARYPHEADCVSDGGCLFYLGTNIQSDFNLYDEPLPWEAEGSSQDD
jgi:mannose-6-phosphate isomerase-like protein (cupin superfamily)